MSKLIQHGSVIDIISQTNCPFPSSHSTCNSSLWVHEHPGLLLYLWKGSGEMSRTFTMIIHNPSRGLIFIGDK